MAPREVTRDHLAGATQAALGSRRRLAGVARLAGGTRKGVYRLTMDDGATVIAYLWEESENFWPQTPHDGDPADQFSSCDGADMFEAARRDRRIAGTRERFEDRLRELAAAVRPRAKYSVVHGELGLDHVLVDADGNPVIIDIEDLMYFDVEWEHAHMQIRLHGDWAKTAGVEGLDEDRLTLYLLTQHLSLTAGPLRLLDSDFPDRKFIQSIAEHNLNKALEFVV